MKPLHWILLAIAAISVITLSFNTVDRYTAIKDTISGVKQESFLSATSGVLASTNSHFETKNISIKDVLYINDSIALVTLDLEKEKTSVYVIFELRDGRLYLTNYSSTGFSNIDFFSEDIEAVRYIIDASNQVK